MSSRVKFLTGPYAGEIRTVPFLVGARLVADGSAEDARDRAPVVTAPPPIMATDAPALMPSEPGRTKRSRRH